MPLGISNSWLDMADSCVDLLKSQIETEIKAAMTYLAMVIAFL